LFEDFVCDFQLRLGKLHTRKKPARFLDRKLADIRDGFPRDPHGSRFGAQTRAAALGTAGVAAVAAQKHTHMQLIFLALQPLEKPLHPLIIVFQWLERKKYKLHVRVFLSRYRGYASCPE